MRSALFSILICGLVLPSTVLAQRGGRNFSQQTAAQFGWHSNYARGLEEARADNKPVMLVFRCVP